MKEHKHLIRLIFLFLVLWIIGVSLPAAGMTAEPKPGDIINTSNVDQYKDYFPYFAYRFVKDGWNGWQEPAVIHVKEVEPNLPPEYWFELSEKNKGKSKLNKDGTITGHEVGLPFPDPKEPNKALKIMWNVNYRWRSDGIDYPDDYSSFDQRKGGRQISIDSNIKLLFWKNRCTPPSPELPNNSRNLHWTMLFTITDPPNKDLAMLTWRYDDSAKNDDMWSYIPTLRRTLRMVSSERQNPVRGSAGTWDDFYVFDGKVPDYTPTLVGEHTFLTLMHQKTLAYGKYARTYPHPLVAGENDPWELREFWEVDVVYKNPKSPEQKKSLYILKNTYDPVMSQIYDKKGNLWKGIWYGFSSMPTVEGNKGIFATYASVNDFKTNFWTGYLLRNVVMNTKFSTAIFQPGSLGMKVR